MKGASRQAFQVAGFNLESPRRGKPVRRRSGPSGQNLVRSGTIPVLSRFVGAVPQDTFVLFGKLYSRNSADLVIMKLESPTESLLSGPFHDQAPNLRQLFRAVAMVTSDFLVRLLVQRDQATDDPGSDFAVHASSKRKSGHARKLQSCGVDAMGQ